MIQHPSKYIIDEMDKFGFTVSDLAGALDLSDEAMYELLAARSHVTPELAEKLAYVIGLSAEKWLRRQHLWNATGQETEMLKSRLECSKRQARRWKKLVHQTQGKMAVLRHENNKLRAANDKLRNPE